MGLYQELDRGLSAIENKAQEVVAAGLRSTFVFLNEAPSYAREMRSEASKWKYELGAFGIAIGLIASRWNDPIEQSVPALVLIAGGAVSGVIRTSLLSPKQD